MRRTFAILLITCLYPVFYAGAQDTIRHRTIEMWRLSPDLTEEVKVPFDTTFSLFNHYRLADKYSPFNAYPGSYGLPFYQLNFFDRVTDPDKHLLSNFYPLMYQPERYLFMNTQVPFTEFVWTYAGPRDQAEQTFRIRHSQNVNRKLNLALVYDIVYNLGQYSYQRSSDKNFTFNGSYRGDKYTAYFAYGLNNMTTLENGGISDLSQLETLDPKNVEVNLGGLSKARSYLKNSNLMLVQRYALGKKGSVSTDSTRVSDKPFWLSGSFSHILAIDGNRRTYEDSNPASGFYDSVYISNTRTFDSLSARTIKNTVRFDFTTDENSRFRLAGGVGIRNELIKYSQIVPTHDTLLADTAVWHKHNNVLVGRLYNNIGEKFYWMATGELFLSGYRFGDFNFDGVISKSFSFKKGMASWRINGAIANRQPSFWYEQWGGNHFEWTKSMDKEFRIDVGTSFSYPARKMELRFNYAVIDNYTGFDTLAMPAQHGGGLSVVSVYASKDLRAWKFHLTTDLLFQQSGNPDVLDLPLATARTTGFFEHLFNFRKTDGQMNMQVGAEVLYHTPYYAYSYMPATGRFYMQDKVETGNYPFVNVFMNLKIRRTRIFLMLDHVNAGFTGYNYFMIPSYPMNVRMFRYGLAWTFYD
ncbi:MAG: putative porin [Bacteroidales bacterium]